MHRTFFQSKSRRATATRADLDAGGFLVSGVAGADRSAPQDVGEAAGSARRAVA